MNIRKIEQEEYWKVRAQHYNELQWANEKQYLNAVVEAGDFRPNHLVLDVGTGTGIVLHAIAPKVNEIIGLDISQAMLEHSNWQNNKYFVKRDIREPFFHESVFDRIVARMVFHHIIEDIQKAADECYRILKLGGKFILSEGIPPNKQVKKDYIEIFKLKEKRITFMLEDLVEMIIKAGFRNIQTSTFVMPRMSINNWLEKSGLPAKTQDKIFEMHICASDCFKKAYNMKIIRGDCLIDIKYVILIGEK
jgi:ubiquinone/menaquinone biosynthesis C-methylase UbiE